MLLSLRIRAPLFQTPETIREWVQAFGGNDFWDSLGGQALVMIGRLPLTYHS